MANLSHLNEEQKDAVQNQSQYIMVLAGPGSGKTTVLLHRLQYQIEELDADSTSFLIITFTKAAAKSMEERFHQLTNSNYPSITFSTFHAFFYQILLHAKKVERDSFLTKSEQEQIIKAILDKYHINQKVSQFIQKIQEMGDDLDEVKDRGLMDELTLVKEEYQKEKKKRNKIEYDDMAPMCYQLLKENPRHLVYWREKFSSIYVDEFQDINKSQYAIIKLLCQQENKLLVVGDDDQSIYGFRGSNPKIMQEFFIDFSDTYKIVLGRNYRSTASLVEISRKIIEENQNRMSKNLVGYGGEGEESFYLNKVINEQEEYDMLALKIKEYKNSQAKEVAIIGRTNRELRNIKIELGKRGVSSKIFEKKKNLLDHFIIQDLKIALDIANGESQRKEWLKLIEIMQLDLPRDILHQSNLTMDSLFSPINLHGQYGSILGKLKADLEMIKKSPLSLGINYIRKKMRYDYYLKKKAIELKLDIDELFFYANLVQEHGRRYPNYEDFMLQYKEVFSKYEYIEQETDIVLLTMHMSKGLEFQRVFILDCNYGVLPKGKNLTQESIEEERRLFYVAMTRAKKTLDIFYLIGTKENPRQPSLFLKPIGIQ